MDQLLPVGGRTVDPYNYVAAKLPVATPLRRRARKIQRPAPRLSEAATSMSYKSPDFMQRRVVSGKPASRVATTSAEAFDFVLARERQK
ncbi:MAG TPA: hypothetical protein VFX07_03300 [Candidatus Udaeobacter sp.]|nr:hypothetical protein [Candidatus Udaeobacter sp.]